MNRPLQQTKLGSDSFNLKLSDPRQQERAIDKNETEFQRGWTAALQAARDWHEAKARQAIVLSRRTRFPKNLEREAEVHKHAAEMITTLSPDDV